MEPSNRVGIYFSFFVSKMVKCEIVILVKFQDQTKLWNHMCPYPTRWRLIGCIKEEEDHSKSLPKQSLYNSLFLQNHVVCCKKLLPPTHKIFPRYGQILTRSFQQRVPLQHVRIDELISFYFLESALHIRYIHTAAPIHVYGGLDQYEINNNKKKTNASLSSNMFSITNKNSYSLHSNL